MSLRNGSRQIAAPPVERTQYTPSSEPDDEEDSTPDPRQASGNCHGSEHSPEVTREPSGGRTLSEIDEELGTVSKLLLKLCRQGYDDESWNSNPYSGDTPSTPIQGEDPKDPGDKNIPNTRQGRVSRAANPSSMSIAANVTAITKAIIPIGVSPNTTTQDSNVNLGPDNFWYTSEKLRNLFQQPNEPRYEDTQKET
ncbi:hypothetical protein V8E54_003519 [Elaphomyces granulatus]